MYTITSKDKDLYNAGFFSLGKIVEAYENKDPNLAEYVIKLAIIDPAPLVPIRTIGSEEQTNPAETKHTTAKKCDFSYREFRQNYHFDAINPDILLQVTPKAPLVSRSIRSTIRIKRAQLFSDRFLYFIRDASVVPERIKLGEFLVLLYEDQSPYAQDQLTTILQYIPLKWGPWQGFKYIAKRVLLDQRWILFAVIYDRWRKLHPYIQTQRKHRSKIKDGVFPIDIQQFHWGNSSFIQERSIANDITTETHIYMSRHLQSLFEKHFETLDTKSRQNIATSVFAWTSQFTNNDFWYSWSQEYYWQQTGVEKDLLELLTSAKCREVRNWAFDIIERHHRNVLQNLPPEWIVEQSQDPFANSKIKNVIQLWIREWTTIERADFFKYDLHQVVMGFLDSKNTTLESYACTFIRDFIFTKTEYFEHLINLDKVLWFLRSSKDIFHYLGIYLLFPEGEKSDGDLKSPFIDQLDFTFWTDLLGDTRMHDRAVERIRKGFSKDEISEEWLRQRLFSTHSKVSALAKDWIEEGYHDPKIDFYNIFCELIFSKGIPTTLQDFAFQRLTLRDVEEKSMLDRFTTVDYRNLFFHPRADYRNLVINAYKNRELGNELFPLEMSKWLLHQNDYKIFISDAALRNSFFTSTNIPTSLPSDISSFLSQRIQDELNLELSQFGYMWMYHRSQCTTAAYHFLRNLFQQQFPVSVLHIALEKKDWRTEEERQQIINQQEQRITQFLSSNPSAEEQKAQAKNTLQLIFSILNQEMDQNSTLSRQWRSYVLSHLPAPDQNPDFRKEVFFPDDSFDREWFLSNLEKLRSGDKAKINFMIDIAQKYINRWTKQPGFGFTQLKPLLFHHFTEVQKFILRCIESPLSVEESIDLNDPCFLPEELHEFCFDPNDTIREYGMKLIKSFPERFGQPDKLIQLSQSSDPVVRNMVVEIIWYIANIPQVTTNWKPSVESVLPQKVPPDSKKYIKPRRMNPPKAMSKAYQKIKYLGEGTPQASKAELTNYSDLKDFMKRQFFRLPSKPPSRKEKNNSVISKTESQTSDSQQKISSGESKRLLIISMKNLAIQDKEFALVSIPIFQELIQSNMKEIRETVIAALVQINETHQMNIL